MIIKLKRIILNSMTTSRLNSYFNYLFIAISILWKPLQNTILTVDAKGRILLLLTIMSFFVNCNRGIFKKILCSKPVVFWLLWCIYVTINTYFQGFDNSNITFLYFTFNSIFSPCMIMTVSAYEYLKDPPKFLKTIIFIYLIYAFIGAFVMDIGYVALEEGTFAYIMLQLNNSIAVSFVYIALCIIIYFVTIYLLPGEKIYIYKIRKKLIKK